MWIQLSHETNLANKFNKGVKVGYYNNKINKIFNIDY